MTTPTKTFPHPVDIRVGDIRIEWASAQRDKNDMKRARNAKRIADEFNMDYFQSPTVAALPDGTYHPCDGWTRIMAAKIALGMDAKVPCFVIVARNAREAAKAFIEINGGRTRESAMDRFHIAVEAEEPGPLAISRIVAGLGLKIGPTPAGSTIAAVTVLASVYRDGGSDGLIATLSAIKSCWPPNRDAWDGNMIRGWFIFLHQHGEKVSMQRAVSKVGKRYAPGNLLGAGVALYRTGNAGSVSAAIAMNIAKVYDLNSIKNRLTLDRAA